jgi:replicative DNA helicase
MNKTMINNPQYEQSVMWYLLQPEISTKTVPTAIRLLKGVNPFYTKLYRQAWDGIQKLYHEEQPISIESLDHYFLGINDVFLTPEEADLLDDPETVFEFDPIENYAYYEEELEHFINLLLDVYKRRELQRLGYNLTATLAFSESSADDISMNINQQLSELNSLTEHEDINQYGIDKLLKATNTELEKIAENDGLLGFSTGFSDLDVYLSGVHIGEYMVIAGRPSMGKSTFADVLAYHLASEKHKTAIVTYEMNYASIVHKFIASEMNVDSNDIRNGFIVKSEKTCSNWIMASSTIQNKTKGNLFIIDNWSDDIDILVEKMSYYAESMGIEVFIIDYLQKLFCKRMRHSGGNREQEVSAISDALQKLSHRKHISIIALSQLSRGCDARPEKRPMLSDLRESGAVEQDADTVLFLYRDAVYSGDKMDKTLEVIIAKQRNGGTGTVFMHYDMKTSKIVQRAR